LHERSLVIDFSEFVLSRPRASAFLDLTLPILNRRATNLGPRFPVYANAANFDSFQRRGLFVSFFSGDPLLLSLTFIAALKLGKTPPPPFNRRPTLGLCWLPRGGLVATHPGFSWRGQEPHRPGKVGTASVRERKNDYL